MAVYLPGPPYPFGQIDYPRPGQFLAEGDAAAATNYRAPRGKALALVAYPYDTAVTGALFGPPFPFGTPAWPMATTIPIPGGTRRVVASTHGFTSRPTDTPARTWFAPIVDDAFNFEIEMFAGVDPAESPRAGRAGFGEVRIKDAEGRFDDLVGLGWEGRRVEIWRGPRGKTFADFERVANLTSAGWRDLNSATKSLAIRDQQERLYATQLLTATYSGAGGINGDAGAVGQLRPLAVGYVFHVPPVLIDAGNLVYQWSYRGVRSVDALKVGGVEWTDMGDHASYAALVAASLTNGQFATCNALGVVRLGAQPAFGVRIDGEGDNLGGYAETRAAIVRKLACSMGALPLVDPDELELSSFGALAVAQPAAVGFWWNSPITIGAALDEVMAGCCGQWWVDLEGMLSVAQIEPPSTVADLVLDYAGADPLTFPVMAASLAPRTITRVGYQRNYGPQVVGDLAGIVAADQKLYGDEWRYCQVATESARTVWPTAREVFVPGAYKLKASADAEAARQQSIFSRPIARWRVQGALDPFASLINKTVEIRNWNRYGAGASKFLRCVRSASGRAGVSSSIDLWGA